MRNVSSVVGEEPQLREVRRPRVDALLQDAGLPPGRRYSPEQIASLQGYYNGALASVDGARERRWAIAPELFTAPASDAQVLPEDREAYFEARREGTRAERQSRTLGPGVHERPDGSRVEVTDGRVRTEFADGSSREVNYDPEDRTRVSVLREEGEGARALEIDGARVGEARIEGGRRTPAKDVARARATFEKALKEWAKSSPERAERLEHLQQELASREDLTPEQRERLLAQAILMDTMLEMQSGRGTPETLKAGTAARDLLQATDSQSPPPTEQQQRADEAEFRAIMRQIWADQVKFFQEIQRMLRDNSLEIFQMWMQGQQKQQGVIDRVLGDWSKAFSGGS